MFLALTTLTFTLITDSAKADETISEKLDAAGNSSARALSKGAHRIQETLCTKSTAGCAADKIKNRAGEAKAEVVDGAKRIKSKVD